MDSDHREEPDWADPYAFAALWSIYRKALSVIGNWPEEILSPDDISALIPDHDHLRQLVGWNFLSTVDDSGLRAYEPGITTADHYVFYKITRQAREFASLETNNVSDLQRAILLLLRADFMPETRLGDTWSRIRTIGFHSLVMLLNRSEQAVADCLRRLAADGFVTCTLVYSEATGRVVMWGTSIEITNAGLHYLEGKAGAMSFNNLHIVNSTVGLIALQSSLTNIDVALGTVRDRGETEIADALADITREVTESTLTETQKKDVLEQVELLADQAQKPVTERKRAIANAAFSYLERSLSVGEKLGTLWQTWSPILSSYFTL